MKKFFAFLKKVNQNGLLIGLVLLALLLPAVAFLSSLNNSTLTSSKAFTTYYAPTISSVPPASVTVGQKYTYKIVASDPQNLPLNYGILTYPAYKEVSITDSTVSGTFTKAGVYPLVIYVSNGHKSSPQGVAINVIPASLEEKTGGNNNIVQASNPPTVTITYPAEGSVIGGPQNRITWTASSTVGISKVDIYYSVDGTTWNEIVKGYTGNTSTYNWDTSNISDGKYYLRVDATDRSQTPLVTSSISQRFDVKNPLKQTANPTYTEADRPKIVGSFQPGDNDTITETKPTIKVDYDGGNSDIDVTAVVVKLDNKEVKADVGLTSLNYNVTEALAPGQHTVDISLKNKKGLDRQVEWTFTVITNANPQANTNQPSNTQTVLGLNPIIGTIIIIVIVFLIVLAVLFGIFKLIEILRGKDQPDDITHITNYYSPQGGPAGTSPLAPVTPVTPTASDNTYNPYVVSTPAYPANEPTNTQIESTTTNTPVVPSVPTESNFTANTNTTDEYNNPYVVPSTPAPEVQMNEPVLVENPNPVQPSVEAPINTSSINENTDTFTSASADQTAANPFDTGQSNTAPVMETTPTQSVPETPVETTTPQADNSAYFYGSKTDNTTSTFDGSNSVSNTNPFDTQATPVTNESTGNNFQVPDVNTDAVQQPSTPTQPVEVKEPDNTYLPTSPSTSANVNSDSNQNKSDSGTPTSTL